MRTGKISQAVFERSVERVLRFSGANPRFVRYGTDGATMIVPEGTDHLAVGVCSGSIGSPLDRTVEMLLAGAINNLAASGSACRAVTCCLTVAPSVQETQMKDVIERIGRFCGSRGIAVLGGDTHVSDGVNRMLVSVTALGSLSSSGQEDAAGITKAQQEENYALLMTGYAAQAGTGILARALYPELKERFSEAFLRKAALGAHPDQLLVDQAATIARQHGAGGMHDISVGGVLGALWEMAEQMKARLDVDLRAIPIRQETIEICEVLDLNPYQLFGQGGLLVAVKDPMTLRGSLARAGIESAVIGRMTCLAGTALARRIHSAGQVRCLDKPAQDALWVMADRLAK